MASRIALINQTLAHLKQDAVDAAEVEAVDRPQRLRVLLAHEEAALDALLDKGRFAVARAYARLEPSADYQGSLAYPFTYELPLAALRVVETDRTGGWEQGAETHAAGVLRPVLRAREGGPLNVTYVRRVAVEVLPPLVAEAFSLNWAWRAAPQMTGDLDLRRMLERAASVALQSALAADAQSFAATTPPVQDRLTALRLAAG